MRFSSFRFQFVLFAAVIRLSTGLVPQAARAQSSEGNSRQSSSSSSGAVQQEKSPSFLIDPAGPTISLISSEPVFIMAAAMNACGYDEGLRTAPRYGNTCATR